MPTYKLTYFNGRGRAETSRMLFKLAKQDFEDKRIQREDWPELKPKTPVGQLPTLEVDGKVFCQSNAFNRYLAKQFGFAGKSDLDQATVDMIMDTIEDATPKIAPLFREQDAEKKAELQKTFLEETLEPLYANLSKFLESNNGGDGFFVGDGVTLADLTFLNMAALMAMVANAPQIYEKFPKLKALKERVEAIPELAAWIAARPVTDF